ncbi:DUF6101 family protein [Bartonella sp. CB178]|uniref:DUF6101 family protein n=1 Tax=Bartonella sp. CB178 TaxID=3112255 RepID=UPI00300DD3AA
MADRGFNQAKAGVEFRLDPFYLPQTTTYFSPKTGNEMTCSLGESGVFLKTDSSSSLLHLVPACHYRGISARTVKTPSGDRAVALELFHVDEESCIPLLVSRDLNNVLLDWRLWADIYNLPMLMINEDGSSVVVKERSDLRRFFHRTLRCKRKRFSLRCGGSLGLRLIMFDQVAI